MKKLKLNSTLNHKQSDYQTREMIVEKVITLYGKSFSELKNHPLSDNPYIAQNRDQMYIDSNDTAHCLLMVDYDSGDGILVESEGSNYARKSQFISNAEALEREDIQMVESRSIDVDFQPDITVEVKPTQELTLYCPLRIVRDYDESDYEFDEEVLDEQEEIPSRYAIDCAREINAFIRDYSEPEEEHRGLMVYFDDNPAVSEKVFSAIPSVKEISGELMGVFECQIAEELTGNELEDLRSHLIGQCSDGFFEGMEQHPINTADYGEIYVSFWNAGNDWSLQTAEEMGLEQTEDLSEEPDINMTM